MSDKRQVLKEEEAIEIHKSLTERNKLINERIIRFETELETLKKEYERECQKAIELIGTSDIDECRSIYAEKRKENSDMLYELMDSYDKIEQVIANIEEARSATEEA